VVYATVLYYTNNGPAGDMTIGRGAPGDNPGIVVGSRQLQRALTKWSSISLHALRDRAAAATSGTGVHPGSRDSGAVD
jgi:hypothetical protein